MFRSIDNSIIRNKKQGRFSDFSKKKGGGTASKTGDNGNPRKKEFFINIRTAAYVHAKLHFNSPFIRKNRCSVLEIDKLYTIDLRSNKYQ